MTIRNIENTKFAKNEFEKRALRFYIVTNGFSAGLLLHVEKDACGPPVDCFVRMFARPSEIV
jgi:hypothetical protein